MTRSQRGFTVVETLLAALVAAVLMVAVAQTFSFVVSFVGDEGRITDADDESVPLAPSPLQDVAAKSLLGQVSTEFADARWFAVADRAEATMGVPVSDTIDIGHPLFPLPVNLDSTGAFFAYTVAFRTFLAEAPMVGTATPLPFDDGEGFSVFGFSSRDRLIGVLSVGWRDNDEGYRIYTVRYRRSSSSVAHLMYRFAEPLSVGEIGSVQEVPSVAFLNAVATSSAPMRPMIEVSLPDPTIHLAKDIGRLNRGGVAEEHLNAARGNMPSSSALVMSFPLLP